MVAHRASTSPEVAGSIPVFGKIKFESAPNAAVVFTANALSADRRGADVKVR